MGTGSGGEEGSGREAWDFLEPAQEPQREHGGGQHLAEPRAS